jgi:antitoxin component YwqK of YwqJK toxin-antitoxin module
MNGQNFNIVRRYFDSGKLMFEYYENERKEKNGISRHWYENGQLMSEANYCNGLAEGILRQWTESGQLIRYSESSIGKLQGRYQSWWDDGILKEDGYYVDDKRQIGYRWFKTDGSLWSKIEADSV